MLKTIVTRTRREIPRPSTIALIALGVMTADYFFDPYRGHGRSVGRVRSFLHVPGTPAPNKLPALLANHH